MNHQRLLTNLRILSKLFRFTNEHVKAPHRTFTTLSHYERNTLSITQKLPALYSIQCRNYAKNRDKVKSGVKKVEIREDIMSEAINVEKFKSELQGALDEMKDKYIKQLSLRSAAGVVETLHLEFEGDEYTIQDLAQINRKNPKVLVLNFSSFPQTIPIALDAIAKSGMNLNPQQDGTSLFIPIPKVTREHRENLAKGAKTLLNKCKDNIRIVQSKYLRKLDLKQSEGLSVENVHRIKDQIMAVVSLYLSMAEKMKEDKQKELMKED